MRTGSVKRFGVGLDCGSGVLSVSSMRTGSVKQSIRDSKADVGFLSVSSMRTGSVKPQVVGWYNSGPAAFSVLDADRFGETP